MSQNKIGQNKISNQKIFSLVEIGLFSLALLFFAGVSTAQANVTVQGDCYQPGTFIYLEIYDAGGQANPCTGVASVGNRLAGASTLPGGGLVPDANYNDGDDYSLSFAQPGTNNIHMYYCNGTAGGLGNLLAYYTRAVVDTTTYQIDLSTLYGTSLNAALNGDNVVVCDELDGTKVSSEARQVAGQAYDQWYFKDQTAGGAITNNDVYIVITNNGDSCTFDNNVTAARRVDITSGTAWNIYGVSVPFSPNTAFAADLHTTLTSPGGATDTRLTMVDGSGNSIGIAEGVAAPDGLDDANDDLTTYYDDPGAAMTWTLSKTGITTQTLTNVPAATANIDFTVHISGSIPADIDSITYDDGVGGTTHTHTTTPSAGAYDLYVPDDAAASNEEIVMKVGATTVLTIDENGPALTVDASCLIDTVQTNVFKIGNITVAAGEEDWDAAFDSDPADATVCAQISAAKVSGSLDANFEIAGANERIRVLDDFTKVAIFVGGGEAYHDSEDLLNNALTYSDYFVIAASNNGGKVTGTKVTTYDMKVTSSSADPAEDYVSYLNNWTTTTPVDVGSSVTVNLNNRLYGDTPDGITKFVVLTDGSGGTDIAVGVTNASGLYRIYVYTNDWAVGDDFYTYETAWGTLVLDIDSSLAVFNTDYEFNVAKVTGNETNIHDDLNGNTWDVRVSDAAADNGGTLVSSFWPNIDPSNNGDTGAETYTTYFEVPTDGLVNFGLFNANVLDSFVYNITTAAGATYTFQPANKLTATVTATGDNVEAVSDVAGDDYKVYRNNKNATTKLLYLDAAETTDATGTYNLYTDDTFATLVLARGSAGTGAGKDLTAAAQTWNVAKFTGDIHNSFVTGTTTGNNIQVYDNYTTSANLYSSTSTITEAAPDTYTVYFEDTGAAVLDLKLTDEDGYISWVNDATDYTDGDIAAGDNCDVDLIYRVTGDVPTDVVRVTVYDPTPVVNEPDPWAVGIPAAVTGVYRIYVGAVQAGLIRYWDADTENADANKVTYRLEKPAGTTVLTKTTNFETFVGDDTFYAGKLSGTVPGTVGGTNYLSNGDVKAYINAGNDCADNGNKVSNGDITNTATATETYEIYVQSNTALYYDYCDIAGINTEYETFNAKTVDAGLTGASETLHLAAVTGTMDGAWTVGANGDIIVYDDFADFIKLGGTDNSDKDGASILNGGAAGDYLVYFEQGGDLTAGAIEDEAARLEDGDTTDVTLFFSDGSAPTFQFRILGVEPATNWAAGDVVIWNLAGDDVSGTVPTDVQYVIVKDSLNEYAFAVPRADGTYLVIPGNQGTVDLIVDKGGYNVLVRARAPLGSGDTFNAIKLGDTIDATFRSAGTPGTIEVYDTYPSTTLLSSTSFTTDNGVADDDWYVYFEDTGIANVDVKFTDQNSKVSWRLNVDNVNNDGNDGADGLTAGATINDLDMIYITSGTVPIGVYSVRLVSSTPYTVAVGVTTGTASDTYKIYFDAVPNAAKTWGYNAYDAVSAGNLRLARTKTSAGQNLSVRDATTVNMARVRTAAALNDDIDDADDRYAVCNNATTTPCEASAAELSSEDVLGAVFLAGNAQYFEDDETVGIVLETKEETDDYYSYTRLDSVDPGDTITVTLNGLVSGDTPSAVVTVTDFVCWDDPDVGNTDDAGANTLAEYCADTKADGTYKLYFGSSTFNNNEVLKADADRDIDAVQLSRTKTSIPSTFNVAAVYAAASDGNIDTVEVCTDFTCSAGFLSSETVDPAATYQQYFEQATNPTNYYIKITDNTYITYHKLIATAAFGDAIQQDLGGSMSGDIDDAILGGNISGAAINLYDAGSAGTIEIARTVTIADGTYILYSAATTETGYNSAAYDAKVSKNGYITRDWSTDPNVWAAAVGDALASFELDAAVVNADLSPGIRIQVTDVGGNPVNDATVTIHTCTTDSPANCNYAVITTCTVPDGPCTKGTADTPANGYYYFVPNVASGTYLGVKIVEAPFETIEDPDPDATINNNQYLAATALTNAYNLLNPSPECSVEITGGAGTYTGGGVLYADVTQNVTLDVNCGEATGLTVTADLTNIGGGAAQALTNDADGTYSWTGAVGAGAGSEAITITTNDGVNTDTDIVNVYVDNTAPTNATALIVQGGSDNNTSEVDLDGNVTWIWTAGTDANSGLKNYEIVLQSDTACTFGGAETTVWTKYTTDVSYTVGNLTDGLCYRMRVKAVDNVGNVAAAYLDDNDAQVLIDSSRPDQVVLLTPTYNSYATADPVTLTWENLDGESNFWVQVDDDDNFAADLIGEKNNVAADDTNATVGAGGDINVALVDGTTYYWRVKARDANDNDGMWSEIFKFIFDDTLPAAINITAPVAGATVTNTAFTVTVAAGETGLTCKYKVQADAGAVPTFAQMGDWLADLNTNNYTGTAVVPADGVYDIYVACRDAAGNGATDDNQNFTVDTTGPAITAVEPDPEDYAIAGATITITSGENINCYYATDDLKTAVPGAGWTAFDTGQGTTTPDATNLVPAAQGRAFYYVKCEDANGIEMVDNIVVTWTYDNVVPTYDRILTATSGISTTNVKANDTVTLTIVASEAMGVDPTITLETVAPDAPCTKTGTTYVCIWTMDASFADASTPDLLVTLGQDLAGNADTDLTEANIVTVDKTLPTVTLTAIADPQNSRSFLVQADADEEVTCRLSTDTAVYANMGITMTETVDGTDIHEATLTVPADADYTVFVTCQDTAGNTGTDNQAAVTVDTTAPTESSIIINGGVDYTNNATLALTLNANNAAAANGMNFSCDGDNWTGWENYAAAKALNLTTANGCNVLGAVADGDKIIYFKTIDVNNNEAPAVYDEIILDRTAPGDVTAVNDPGAVDEDGVVTWTWAAAVDATSGTKDYEVKIAAGSADCSAGLLYTDYTPDVSYTYSGLVDGSNYYACVKARDNAGNLGAAVNSNEILIDTLVPDQVVLNTPADRGYWTTDLRPTFGWTDVAGEDTYQLQISQDFNFSAGFDVDNAAVPAGGTTGAQVTYTLTAGEALVSGTLYYWRVRALDANASDGMWSEVWLFTVDNAAPVISVAEPGNQNTRSFLVTVTATGEAGLTCKMSTNNVGYAAMEEFLADIGPAGTYQGMITVPVDNTIPADGDYIVYAACRDAAGNEDADNSNEFAVESIAPTVTASAPAYGIYRAANLPAITITTDVDANCKWDTFDGNYATMANVFAPLAGVPMALGAAAAEGLNVFYIRCQTTTTAVEMSSSAMIIFTYDSVVPSTPIRLLPVTGTAYQTGSILAWGAAADATSGVASYTLQMDSQNDWVGPNFVQVAGLTTNAYELTAAPGGDKGTLAAGLNYWRVMAIDNAGNIGAWTAGNFTFTLDKTAPAVEEMDPNDNATGVNVGASPLLVFNERIEPSTLIGANIQLHKYSDDSVVALDAAGGIMAENYISEDGTYKTYVIIVPAANLENSDPLVPNSGRYYITISAAVVDMSGNPFVAWAVADKANHEFTTAAVQTGALSIDYPIVAIKQIGTPDNSYANGFEWVARITLPTNQPNIALQFADWTNSLAAGGNMQYYSEQILAGLGSAGTPVDIITASTYPANVLVGNDADGSRNGIQTDIHIKLKIPGLTPAGAHSTTFKVRSQ